MPTEREVSALVSSARTPAEHLVLANYFESRGKAYDSEAAEHLAMLDAPQGGRLTMGPAHCERLAEKLRAQAREAGATAALHRELAAAGD